MTLGVAQGSFAQKSKDEKRAVIREAKTEILAALYKEYPEARQKINSSVGYATFDNKQMNLLLLATGNGKGMVTDNRTGKETFMAMGSVGVGVGLGAKDLSVVFIFKDGKTLDKFVKEGWQFDSQADATAKTKEEGGDIGTEASVSTDVKLLEIYTITDQGVALQATVAGTKYWKLKKLN